LTPDAYLALEHIVVAPLGRPSHVDDALAARGHSLKIRHVVPDFAGALRDGLNLLLAAVAHYVLQLRLAAHHGPGNAIEEALGRASKARRRWRPMPSARWRCGGSIPG
jgi:hypothetical protein